MESALAEEPNDYDKLREFNRRMSELTSLDHTLLDALCMGLTNRSIATRLGKSERAVETRRSKIMKVLGVRSPVELGVVVGEARALKRYITIDDAHEASGRDATE